MQRRHNALLSLRFRASAPIGQVQDVLKESLSECGEIQRFPD
jgi:hypothetical protein